MAQIVIEGPDGSGKSTVAQRLTEWLNEKGGVRAIHTRHPGATPLGRELRKMISDPEMSVGPQTRALLFAADNSAYISSILTPKLEQGTWIVADRNNYISSMAYQIADGCSLDALDKIHAATFPMELIPKIDLLIIMRVSYETACSRREVRSANEKNETFEKKMSSRDFFDRVSNAYDKIIDEHMDRVLHFVHETCGEIAPEGTPRVLYIDANKSFEEVFADVQEAVKVLLNERVVNL